MISLYCFHCFLLKSAEASFIAFFDSWKLYGLCPTVIITVEETEKNAQ